MMPVPFIANSVEDKEVMLSQHGVRQVFDMAMDSAMKLVGIGTVEPAAQLVEAGMIDVSEINAISASGAVGEILGHFFTAKGQRIDNGLTARTNDDSFGSATPRQYCGTGGWANENIRHPGGAGQWAY